MAEETSNITYGALYMKIDCKYRYSVDFVNEKIRRRINLAELKENDDCVFSATQESREGSI